jgi:tetratricopeptide (TPR) repeat protein
MNSKQEDLYLEAEADVRNQAYLEAKQKYESILYDEPKSAAVHNSLGWIYKTQLEDYEKAENHYNAAIRYDAHYPHPYLNLCHLFFDTERFDELDIHAKQALEIPTVDKSFIYEKLGMKAEHLQKYDEASIFYTMAGRYSYNEERVEDIKKCLARVEWKKGL